MFRSQNKGILKMSNGLFFASLGFALVSSVLAIYLESFVHNDAKVGFIFAGIMFISFISYFIAVPFLEKRDKSKIYLLSLILIAASYFMYYFIENLLLFILLMVFTVIISVISLTSRGLIVEHLSDKKHLARDEGFAFTSMNLAWVIGPLLVGFLLAYLTEKYIFLLAALMILLSAFVFKISKIRYSGINKAVHKNFVKNFYSFFTNKDRVKVYILNAGVTFWWSLIFIYSPLFIIKYFDDSYVGYFLFFSMLPLIFIEYYAGKKASEIGYKKIFFVGYLITGILTITCFFIGNVYWILGFLCLSSFGIGLTEATTESYFFDILKKKEDQRYYAPYNTGIDAGRLIGQFIPALILLILPFKSIFLFFGIVMLSLAALSLKIKDIVETKRKGTFY